MVHAWFRVSRFSAHASYLPTSCYSIKKLPIITGPCSSPTTYLGRAKERWMQSLLLRTFCKLHLSVHAWYTTWRTYLLSMRIIEPNARHRSKYIYPKFSINMISYWARCARQLVVVILITRVRVEYGKIQQIFLRAKGKWKFSLRVKCLQFHYDLCVPFTVRFILKKKSSTHHRYVSLYMVYQVAKETWACDKNYLYTCN